jgi:hypothetical protein
MLFPYNLNPILFYSCIHTSYCLVLSHKHAAAISHAFFPTILLRLPWLLRTAWREPSTCVCPWRLRWRQGSHGAHSATTMCPLLWCSQVRQGAFLIRTYGHTVLSTSVYNILKLIVECCAVSVMCLPSHPHCLSCSLLSGYIPLSSPLTFITTPTYALIKSTPASLISIIWMLSLYALWTGILDLALYSGERENRK